MRKQVFGRHLQRDTNERKALFKSLMSALVLHESIQTTEAKAKSIKGSVEKLVTKAKAGGVKAERSLRPFFPEPLVQKMISDIAPRFATRPGGYTRIIKLGNRLRDNAKMVILEWVEKKPEIVKAEVLQSEEVTNKPIEAVQAEVVTAKKMQTKKSKKVKPSKTEKKKLNKI